MRESTIREKLNNTYNEFKRTDPTVKQLIMDEISFISSLTAQDSLLGNEESTTHLMTKLDYLGKALYYYNKAQG